MRKIFAYVKRESEENSLDGQIIKTRAAKNAHHNMTAIASPVITPRSGRSIEVSLDTQDFGQESLAHAGGITGVDVVMGDAH